MVRRALMREWGSWALGRAPGGGVRPEEPGRPGEAGRPESGRSGPGARLRPGQELVTVALGTWLMVGLFVDGWAHNNLAELETFFTPWHAVFYSGFTWSAAWVGWQALRSGALERGPRVLPLGYGGAVAGVVLFGLGGLGDMTWHTLLGIEQGIEALFSPTHLLLFLGALLLLSAPFRAAWRADAHGSAPTYQAFLPAVLSLTLTTALFAFMTMYFAAFSTDGAARPAVAFAEGIDPDGAAAFWLQVTTLGSVFTTNVVLLAPLLLLTRRWRPPAGTATTLFVTVAVLTGALDEYRNPQLLVAALVAGVAADLLLRALRPGPDRPAVTWAIGALVPLVVWTPWVAAQALAGGLGWSVEMWTGTVLWSSIFGGVLACLMAPPAPDAAAPAAPVPGASVPVARAPGVSDAVAPEPTVAAALPPPRDAEVSPARD